jgi:SAM-dependent methyltransferase
VLQDSRATRTAPRAPITLLRQYWSDEGSRRRYTDGLFDGTAGEYDFVERLLGLGSGPWYRRHALARVGLAPGMHVLDVATGTGLVAREALRLVGPTGSLVGLDPSAGMLGQATALRVPLVRGFGEQLPFTTGTFDFVSMGFALRHVADLDALFREMHRVLKPGGIACILELTRPSSAAVAAPGSRPHAILLGHDRRLRAARGCAREAGTRGLRGALARRVARDVLRVRREEEINSSCELR